MQDAKLYEMLALFDALRAGKARERGMALKRLQALIDPSAPKKVKGPMYGYPKFGTADCYGLRNGLTL
jgi:hypothetical protein